MARTLATATALALLLSAGVVHGLWTERWHESTALAEAADRVARVPLEIGSWKGSEAEADPAEFAQAGARAYWARTYTDTRTGASVLAILMCGRTGKMAVHTPEVCYDGAGYDLVETPTAQPVAADGGDLGAFWAGEFTKRSVTTTELRLYWAWGEAGRWHASASPRWDFRRRPYLYKLYVSQEGSGAADRAGAARFLSDALPAMNRALFPTGDQEGS